MYGRSEDKGVRVRRDGRGTHCICLIRQILPKAGGRRGAILYTNNTKTCRQTNETGSRRSMIGNLRKMLTAWSGGVQMFLQISFHFT
jgi:hypothetical protein